MPLSSVLLQFSFTRKDLIKKYETITNVNSNYIFSHRIGGGFNPAPNGSIVTPRRPLLHGNQHSPHSMVSSIQGTKLPSIHPAGSTPQTYTDSDMTGNKGPYQ